jgi:release factor glutamine methyltransferase
VIQERIWTVRDALAWTAEYLAGKGDSAPRRSAEWLLSAATGLSRIELYAYHDRPLSDAERLRLREGVKRRAAGQPLQYVTGEMPFRHLVVHIRPGVLIPRPETEVLVDEALKAIAGRSDPIVVDLCTGSGCVALSIAQEVLEARVWATDISSLACDVARENALRLGLAERVAIGEGDLFAGVPAQLRGEIDLVVANPPYIPSADLAQLPSEVGGHEPHLALDGGPDGLGVARRIWSEARQWLKPGGAIALELDEGRVSSAGKEIVEWYSEVRVVSDLAGKPRVLVAFAGAIDAE